MKTKIIPQIKSIKLTDNVNGVAEKISFCDFEISEEILKLLPVAKEIFCENKHFIISDNLEHKSPKTISYKKIEHQNGEKANPEYYEISIKRDDIEIRSLDKKGLMFGLFTLSELAFINDDELSLCEICDEPTLSMRGFSDDISRGQISSTQNFLDIIKRLARYKYNTFMPYIEDVFAFTNIKAWGKYSSPIKKDEWNIIIEFAKSYQMEVRPILNLLGHFDKLSNIKELQPLALKRKNGEVTHVMDPKNPEARKIIVTMLLEIVETFGKGIIHCGGDEPVDLTEVYGKDEGAELFISHYTFIAKELNKLDCTLMMYADFFAPPWGDYAVPIERARQLPEDVLFVFWDYAVRKAYPFVDALHKQDLKMYISPGTWTWKRFTCDIKLCYENTKGLLKADSGRSRGMIMSAWADGGDTLRELGWAGNSIGANFCWSPESDYSYDEIYEIFHKSFYGIEKEDAKKLDVIYHHDTLLPREYEHEFKNVMFADPFLPVEYKEKENIDVMITVIKQAENDIKTIKPIRNFDAFNTLYLAIARINFTAKKIKVLPHEKVMTIEDGFNYSMNISRLADDLVYVKELHEKLWFDCNRASDWELCSIRYDDQIAQLRMLSRNIKSRKYFNMHN